ncbi:hypothetical protein F5884DRAFT_746095 [Xylogone sp. PMI_703]|nr:hypothetical protein F5884DRAFT_746095 [Xylogone sp. PMI_703]
MESYTPVPDSEKAPFLEESLTSKHALQDPVERKRKKIWFLAIGASIIVLVAIATVGFITTPRHAIPTSKPRSECDKTPEEAVKAGCTFDPLTFQWLPKSCPRDFVDEWAGYNNGTQWRYWRDSEGKQEILGGYNEIAMEIGNGEYWTTSGEHATHCAYMLLRYHMVARRGGIADPSTRSKAHAQHCVGYILRMARQSPEWDDISSLGDIGYGSCS